MWCKMKGDGFRRPGDGAATASAAAQASVTLRGALPNVSSKSVPGITTNTVTGPGGGGGPEGAPPRGLRRRPAPRAADGGPLTPQQQGGEACGLAQAEALAASGDVEKALERLRSLVVEVPDSLRASMRMASLLRENRRMNEARVVLEEAVGRAPTAASPREALAEVCLEVGRLDDAIRHSRALLEMLPRSLMARDLLSMAYLQRGHLDKALSVTDEMIRLDPTDPAYHFRRGVLLQQQGEITGAVRAFGRVLEIEDGGDDADDEDDITGEARAALEFLDHYQMRQILMLAAEDVPFRLRLRQRPVETLAAKGYHLSVAGMAALLRIGWDDLPSAPPGWRHRYYH